MKPVAIDYVRVESISDIFEAFDLYGQDARILAGGQSLMAMMNYRLARPRALIDISKCAELNYVRLEKSALVVGAAATQASVEWRETLQEEVPLLKSAFPFISHFQIRNSGTVCGSIAHADPSAELPLCLTALQGHVVVVSRHGQRVLKPDEFFTGMLSTAIEPGEFLKEVRFPLATAGCRYAFDEVAMRRGDFAIVGAAVVMSRDEISLAVGGVADRPVRRAWPGSLSDPDIEKALNEFAWDLHAQSDSHASAEYRRHLVRELGRKLIFGMRHETIS
jgi:2-furoyl-CoA dehydrogenase FAD binding subunit